MSLRTKTTLYFLAMIGGLLVLAGTLIYAGLREVVEEETDEGLWRSWQMIRPTLEQSENPVFLEIPDVSIEAVPGFSGAEQQAFADTLFMEMEDADEAEEGPEFEAFRMLTVHAELRGRPYRVRIFHAAVDAEDLVETILWNVGVVFGIFVAGVLLFQYVISARLWQPFQRVLTAIEGFDLSKRHPVDFGQSTTLEFKRLIDFLDRMAKKARSDYQNLKRFTENAAHEIQTPVTIVRTKLERLLQSEKLAETDAELAAQSLAALQRLSRLNSALLLLSKIENHQFSEAQPVDLKSVLESEIEAQRELMELKSIGLQVEPGTGLIRKINPVLAEVLVRNLVSNAVRHTIEGGKLVIHLDANRLRIANTGAQGALSEDLVFQRFAKQSDDRESSGLGLAIVREICGQYGWEISYRWADGMHVFEIYFSRE